MVVNKPADVLCLRDKTKVNSKIIAVKLWFNFDHKNSSGVLTKYK